MKFQAALFDFDGTLTPSLPLWIAAFRTAMGAAGFDVEDREIVRRCFYRDWQEVARELNYVSVAALQVELHRGLRSAFHEATLFPSVQAILRRVRESGMQIGLVTSAPRFILDDALPRLKLAHFFDYVVCADDVDNHKPHPEPILITLERLGRRSHETIMIGDSTADVLAGKAAGTATALFIPNDAPTFQHIDALRATKPDHIFGAHDELHAILGLDV